MLNYYIVIQCHINVIAASALNLLHLLSSDNVFFSSLIIVMCCYLRCATHRSYLFLYIIYLHIEFGLALTFWDLTWPWPLCESQGHWSQVKMWIPTETQSFTNTNFKKLPEIVLCCPSRLIWNQNVTIILHMLYLYINIYTHIYIWPISHKSNVHTVKHISNLGICLLIPSLLLSLLFVGSGPLSSR